MTRPPMKADALDRFLALGHDGLPRRLCPARPARWSTHGAIGRVLVGAHEHAWSHWCRTAGIRRHPTRRAREPAPSTFGAFGLPEVGVVEPVLVVGALEHQDEQVAAVLGHRAVDDPLGQILPLVDEHVLRLRRADAVVVERVVGERGLEHLVLRRLRIARVEEALAVLASTTMSEKRIQRTSSVRSCPVATVRTFTVRQSAPPSARP